jgi:hypothetical protein
LTRIEACLKFDKKLSDSVAVHMPFVRRYPFRDVEEFQNQIIRMFKDSFGDGALDIEIPKPEAEPPKKVTVKVE